MMGAYQPSPRTAVVSAPPPDDPRWGHFPLSEFQRASDAPLTPIQVDRAYWWDVVLLGPSRDELGPELVSSFVRVDDNVGAGAHRDAWAIDVEPLAADGSKLYGAERERAVSRLHGWIAARLLPEVGEVIDERTHVHVTVRGVGGWGEILYEPTEGQYRHGFRPDGVAALAAIVALGAVVYLVGKA